MPYWAIEASAWQLLHSTMDDAPPATASPGRESSTPSSSALPLSASPAAIPQWAWDACAEDDLPDWCIAARARTLYTSSMQVSPSAAAVSGAQQPSQDATLQCLHQRARAETDSRAGRNLPAQTPVAQDRRSAQPPLPNAVT
eukprot:1016425-Amphidinium_carterae.1